MKVTGGCHCGHIKYEAEVDGGTVRVCHCTDCQKLTGAAFRANIASLPGTFVLISGTPKIYVKTAESGTRRAHGFCAECSTPIYSAALEPNPSTYGLRVGGIDQRSQFAAPTRQIWCRSALPWSMDLTAVEQAERG
ncbi:MAG: GFA family protein [Acetobacteraceae bacterium]|nr:GFA family protein [Acetobacteraceae bacterium]